VSGYLQPRHTAGAANVIMLQAWMLVRGTWQLVKTYPATVSDYAGYSRYSFPVNLPYVGSWRIRAVHADADHVWTNTGWAWVTVLNPMVFPVDGPHSYEDTFGAPRSGGRTHQGTDIMANRGTPCVAIMSGTITSKEGGLGGKVIYLTADNGWSFYYAHLDGWAVRSGRVSAGQRIAYVGNTGNASGGACHLHFQMETPAGLTVNPYPYLRQME
jgi:murein DD-endopeptidase MepM/ murein hydrolase activator NlpD